MAVFTTEHTARKAHACGWCDAQIKPGERYRMQVVTPRDPDLDNTKWLRIRVHPANNCYRYEETPGE